MRKELSKIEEVRKEFKGEFSRYGTKNGYKGVEETLLLKNITDENGRIITDHLWFNLTKGFKDLGELKEGDVIIFNARVKEYEKGYKGYRDDVYKTIEIDYKLSHPSKVRRVEYE